MLNTYLDFYYDVFGKLDIESINRVIAYLSNFDRKRKIYLIGNGGSYTLAEHFAQDLLKKRGLPTIALTNISVLTAFSNDEDYVVAYQRQLEMYGNYRDCLIAFSSSGDSQNIYASLIIAKDELLMKTISFTGFDGGRIKSHSDMNIHVPSHDYGVVESMHSVIFHYIVDNIHEPV